ncbi:LysR family transcriptional regulator [Nocardiopsis ansamitocini]|uniref:LysR family transcriptional regulator n=1 Tax=Nocardiopsis ansamitocini TaxID=1670832 RepID=A0A9W6P251_9ACTN|nr:LysR family transcriptional regulator [Nocardiopsis ansamitocini]GLU45763.1 LysR family transcriptional regulator [Nocardiopsis ansamitocini]
MIDVRRLQLLQALDKHHTVAATAEALHVTPSAISQQLAALAKDAGVALVERSGRRFLLTGAARVLLDHAQVIFAEMERAQSDLVRYTEGSLGVVRVGSFATGISDLIAPALAGLRRTDPGWRFSVVQAEPEESTELLRTGDLDIAVTMSSVHLPPKGSGEFQLHPIMVEPLDAVLAYDHPLAAYAEVDLAADLSDEDWVMSAPGTAWFDCVSAACHQTGFQPRVVHTVDEFSAALALVSAGLGMALMPRLAWSGLTASNVVVRSVRGAPRRHIVAVTRSGADPEPLLSAMRKAASKVPVPSVSPMILGVAT